MTTQRGVWVLGVLAAVGVAAHAPAQTGSSPFAAANFGAPPADTGDARACAALGTLELAELASIESEWLPVAANVNAAADSTGPSRLPAHCRVRGRIEPSIRFELWLPAAADWNGRFLGIGSSGSGGVLRPAQMADALIAGYASSSTDGGHSGTDTAWLADPRLLRDFAYRAIYEMTEQSRALLAAFYGRPANFRYFSGCGSGGHQGLMEAQHFPGDYDGIVAGAPVPAFVAAAIGRIWASPAASLDGGPSLLQPEQTRETLGATPDATLADLSAFRDRGGKLIVYQGWNDTAGSPEATIEWYEAVEGALTSAPGAPAVADFARLFMVPGMAACEDAIVDTQTAIEAWVERGIAPDRIEAGIAGTDDDRMRGRPLCPYPQVARYGGTGSSEQSGSFVCSI